ncbi:hypothetical protein IAU60_001625 [Kwoniella sp. DSM 27419]
MDFIKKIAQEQLSGAMGGNQGQQQQQQGYGQQGGYGGQQGGFDNQQGGYGGQQGGYEGESGGYGGQSQGGFTGGFSGGGEQYNRPHGEGGAGYGGMSGGLPDIDTNAAVSAADQHASNGSQNSDLFSTAMGFLGNMNKDDTDVDEDRVQQQHQEAYGQGNAGNMSANAIGSAAALQALKAFTSGNSQAASGGGGNMQSKMIGMAMSEAAKLFDQSGGAASGNKQDAVTSAGQTIMKLLLKSQFSGMTGGGNSGGLSSLMSMAQKFM